MAKAPTKNLVLNLGEDYSCEGHLAEAGVDINISGIEFQADIKARTSSTVVLASFTFSLLTNGSDGKYVRAMAKETIDTLGISNGVWDQFMVEGGQRTKMLSGTVTVEKAVTITAPV